jgi:hypothetical protein
VGEEADLVIESGGKLMPIEVKATGRPRLADANHLRAFRAEHGEASRAGLLLRFSFRSLGDASRGSPSWGFLWSESVAYSAPRVAIC